jgi:hypothetical protein
MRRIFKIAGLLIVGIIISSLVLAGCSSPASSPAPSTTPKPVSKAAVTLEPAAVTIDKDKKLVIKGTGFSPGASISIGVPELTFEKSELWFGVATAGQDGSFQYTEDDMTRSVLASKKSGSFAVVARTTKGEEAKATLTVNPKQ